MADISSLGNLQPVENLDLENYADSKDYVALPPAGEYILQARPEFPSSAYGATGKGTLSIAIDPTVLGPTNEGFQIRFAKVSATTWKRDGVAVSQVGDYLRSCGWKGELKNNQDIADAVESTAGRTFKAKLDWRAYNKNTKFSVQGYNRFPTDPKTGEKLPYVLDPVDKDEQGEPVKVRAQVVIDRFIACD